MEKHESPDGAIRWKSRAEVVAEEKERSSPGRNTTPSSLSDVSSQEVEPWRGSVKDEISRGSDDFYSPRASFSSRGDGSRASRLRSYLSEPFFDDRRVVVEPVVKPAKNMRRDVGYEWVMVGRAKSAKADGIVAITWVIWLMLLGSTIFTTVSSVVWLLMVVASVVIFPAFLYARDVRRRLPSLTVSASHEDFPAVGFTLKDELDKSLRNTTAFSYSQKDYDALRSSVEGCLPPTGYISLSRGERRQWGRNVVESSVKGTPESVNLLPTIPVAGSGSEERAGSPSSRKSFSIPTKALPDSSLSHRGASSLTASSTRSLSSEDPRKALQGVLRSNGSPRMKELARELISLHSVMDELSPEQGVGLEDVTGEFLALVREKAALSKSPYAACKEELEHLNECVEVLATPVERLRSSYLAGRRGSLESRRNYLADKYPSSGDLTL